MPLPRSNAEILARHAEVIDHGHIKVRVATVTAVHPERQTVDVQLCQASPIFNELGDAFFEPAPGISDVPLATLRGNGMLLWMPVAVGDSVLLLFCDLSCDVWRAGDGTPQAPGALSYHSYDSAFALPMIAPDAKALASPGADPTKIIIGTDSGPEQIKIGPGEIALGATAGDFVALASLVQTELGKISTALGSLVVTATDTVTSAAVTGTAVASSPYVPGSVASSLIKAQ